MIRNLTVLAALVIASPAFAQEHGGEHPPAHPAPHGEQTTEAAPHGGEHGGEGAEGEEHHQNPFQADHNGNGTPDWRDSSSDHYVVTKLAFHAFNLLLILGVIGWFARGSVADGLTARAHDIKKELDDAQKLRDDAEARGKALQARLDKFESEVAKMHADAEADAKAEEERLVKRANDETKRIGELAERNIRDEMVRAQVALRKEAVDLAIDLARNTLQSQIQGDEQKKLAQNFLDALNRDEVSNG